MKKAFSLVEVITILFIVSVGLLGVVSLVIQNIQSQNYNKNNLIAYQLAQEGIELIRRVRDTNWMSGSSYDTNIQSGTYYMDYLDEYPRIYQNDSDLMLTINNDGFYVHDGKEPGSGFFRLISIEAADASSLMVTVRITWQERGGESVYELQMVLYDWL